LLVTAVVAVDDTVAAPIFGETHGIATGIALTGVRPVDAPAHRRTIGVHTVRVRGLHVLDVTGAAFVAVLVAATDGETLGAHGQEARLFTVCVVTTLDHTGAFLAADRVAEDVRRLNAIGHAGALVLGDAMPFVVEVDFDALREARVGVGGAVSAADGLVELGTFGALGRGHTAGIHADQAAHAIAVDATLRRRTSLFIAPVATLGAPVTSDPAI